MARLKKLRSKLASISGLEAFLGNATGIISYGIKTWDDGASSRQDKSPSHVFILYVT